MRFQAKSSSIIYFVMHESNEWGSFFLSLRFAYKYENALRLDCHLPRHCLAKSTLKKKHEEGNKINIHRNPHSHQSLVWIDIAKYF